MRLHRFLKEENIELDFRPLEGSEFDPEHLDPDEDLGEGWRFRRKVHIIDRLLDLLTPTGKIVNRKKCLTDLRNREAKATTGLGLCFAMPHVRTVQAKDFAIGVAIAPSPGLDFGALDDEPVRIFVPMVAPPYNDKYYRKVEKALAEAILDEDEDGWGFRTRLLQAQDPGEVILALRDAID